MSHKSCCCNDRTIVVSPYAEAPAQYGYGGFGGCGSWWWIIILLILFCGWGNNGFGNCGGCNDGCGNGCGNGNNWWIILILLFCCCGCGTGYGRY